MSAATVTVLLWTPFPAQGRAVQQALADAQGIRLLCAADEAEAIALLPLADAALLAALPPAPKSCSKMSPKLPPPLTSPKSKSSTVTGP